MGDWLYFREGQVKGPREALSNFNSERVEA